jgi:hypothetical protein
MEVFEVEVFESNFPSCVPRHHHILETRMGHEEAG